MSATADQRARTGAARVEVACMGKPGFDSRSLAMAAAGKSRRRKDMRISAYPCGHCHKWHLGSSNTKMQRVRLVGQPT